MSRRSRTSTRAALRSLTLITLVTVVMGVMAAAVGCSSSGSSGTWSFNEPPAAAESHAPAARDRSRQRVVVLGHFVTPQNSLSWESVGPGMSDALARTLLNHGDFDVWINPDLARRVQGLVDTTPADRAARLTEIRRSFPQVRLVVTGRVTDFNHTTEVNATAQRRGFFGTKREAIVAIQLNIFDLDLGRVVATDHVYGVAAAPRTPPAELYAGLSFDSYLFWSTPLGRASKEAITESMDVLNRVVPTRDETIRIVRQEDTRRVRIAGGSEATLDRDTKYWVAIPDETTGELVSVVDPDTGLALVARIDSTSRIATTAWLLGKKPADIDLRGAILSAEPPAALARTTGAAAARTAAAATRKDATAANP